MLDGFAAAVYSFGRSALTAVRARNGGVAFTFAVTNRDGDIFETFESAVPNWNVGDTVRLDGNRPFRVTAKTPLERIAEFVDEPLNGVLEVEPLFNAPTRTRR